VKRFSGEAIAIDARVKWRGETDNGKELQAGDELVYILRVYDEAGRTDETDVGETLYISDSRPAGNAADADSELLEAVYGKNSLKRQTIPLAGSRVRLNGADIPEGSTLRLDGENVPLDNNGRFVVERILPAGEHRMDVVITDASGESWERTFNVPVSGEYFFMTGIADLTIGQNDVSGHVEPLSEDDHYDENVFVDGRMAFYLKGKVKGKYLVTAQLDTREDELGEIFQDLHKKDPESLFRRLDPDRYYPVYGDDSTTVSDVDSQGRFYVRVDWDKSQALWGNYNTGITGNEFAQYNRSLYGARYQHRNVDTTGFGDHRTEMTVFASEPNTALAHNEFIGTGGSLYYLRNTDIGEGSEKVRVEVRERDTNRVLENITLQRDIDYDIDEIQGRIILKRPLFQVTSGSVTSIVKDRPLDGDANILMVDYEYVPDEFEADDVTYGARGKGWVNDHVAVGGTYVSESRDGTDYALKGADVTLRVAQGTYVKAEYARTEALQTSDNFFSDNGGLSFSVLNNGIGDHVDGEARLLEARVNHAEVSGGRHKGTSALWWKHRDEGFSVARVDEGVETTEYGAESSWDANEYLSLGVRAAVIDRDGELERKSAGVEANYRPGGKLGLGAEVRYVSEDEDDSGNSAATLVGLKTDYSVSPGTSIYGAVQTAVAQDDDYEDNDLVTLGIDSRVSKRVSLNAEGSTGDRGDAVLFGAEFQASADQSFYGGYTFSTDRTDGRKGVATMGQRRQLGNSLKVFSEDQFISGERESGIGHVYGLEYTPGKELSLSASLQSSDLDTDSGAIERDTVSLASRYRKDRIDSSNKLEYRQDKGSDDRRQWLTTNLLRYRKSESLTLLGKLNLSWTDNRDTGSDDARFAEIDAGFAYRPVSNDRLNMLGKYTYLYDLDSAGQEDAATDERSHVLSVEGMYDLNKRWSVGPKLAWKRGEMRQNRDEGKWFRTRKQLAILRGRYHINRRWDGLAEYRILDVDEANDTRQGVLLSVDRHVNDNLKVGIGYNFTDFSDDLGNEDYQNRGWFINVVGKY
jgi:hypothetical protein